MAEETRTAATFANSRPRQFRLCGILLRRDAWRVVDHELEQGLPPQTCWHDWKARLIRFDWIVVALRVSVKLGW